MSDTNFNENIFNIGRNFNATCWTEILAAGSGDTVSLNSFCRKYWHPLYAFARRSGKTPSEAQDITQDFFVNFLEKERLNSIEQGKGKFRNFLLILFKRFMINLHHKSSAVKRGGDFEKVDFSDAEDWLAGESLSPDEVYAKSWALTLIAQVMNELEKKFTEHGELERFLVMKPFLEGVGSETYQTAAKKLNCTENSFKVAIHRMRKEFQNLLRLHIEMTVENSAEIDEELRFLFEALAK